MTTAAAFPLAAAVAVVGSRHGSPYPVAQFAAAVVQAGGQVVTGCARGVDTAAASAAARAGRPATIYRAASFTPQALATRTRHVITAAAAVAVFPPAGGQLGPGSSLALSLALRRVWAGVAVFVAGPIAPAPVLYQPPGQWVPAAVAGVPGWLWSPAPAPPAMPSLF